MAEAPQPSRIAADIDFEAEGRQAGYLRAPLSRNRSGWGIVEIPIVVVKNGRGPTVLFTGSIHGDECKGPIAVSELARTLRPEAVQGRVIMLPAVNIPAVLAGTRLSPADNRDTNRCFPGTPRGGFRERVAHDLDAVILPVVDVSVDLHTAGHSGDTALSTNMHRIAAPALMARTLAAAEAFGAPFNVVFGGVDEGAALTSAVERRGILSLGTELGGWGRVNREGVRIARRGIRNILGHVGVIEGEPDAGRQDGGAAPGTCMSPPAAAMPSPRRRAPSSRQTLPAIGCAQASRRDGCISSRTSTARRSSCAAGTTACCGCRPGPAGWRAAIPSPS